MAEEKVWECGKGRIRLVYASPYNETTRVRYVRASTSKDFLHWSEPIEVLRADAQDGDPFEHLHQMAVTRIGRQYVSMISMFHVDGYKEMEFEDHGKIVMEEGTCDTQLAVSRDGFKWDRVANRQIFFPRGAVGQWDSHWIVTADKIFYTNDEMWIYYSPSGAKRSVGHRAQIGFSKLPRDRFQALRPKRPNQPAVVETKPLTLKEGDLVINADASNGKIVVELCDFNNKIVEGFSKEDCSVVESDGLDHVIQWKGKKLTDAVDKDKIFRRAIRLRFYMHQASLYAIYLPLE